MAMATYRRTANWALQSTGPSLVVTDAFALAFRPDLVIPKEEGKWPMDMDLCKPIRVVVKETAWEEWVGEEWKGFIAT